MEAFNVLLVEDNLSWKSILEDKLFRALDCSSNHCFIKVVDTFDEAYENLKDNFWHLLVTDIGLGDSSRSPQKLGIQLVSLAHSRHIPAIAVSGTPVVTTSTVRDLLKEYGASDFFSKEDFNSKDFITKVQEIIQNSKTQDENQQAPLYEILLLDIQSRPSFSETASPENSITNGKQKRLEKERTALQAEWDIRHEKISQIKLDLAMETGTVIKFQLTQGLLIEEARLTEIKNKLEILEAELASPN
jgi:CheY-like chemotaxis protein